MHHFKKNRLYKKKAEPWKKMQSNHDTTEMWKKILSQAINTSNLAISEYTQYYLANMINHNMKNTNFNSTPASTEWLQYVNNHKKSQHLGDKCLLIIGLFPEIAKQTTSINFYILMGKKAYGYAAKNPEITEKEKQILLELENKFIPIGKTIALIKKNT